MITNVNKVILVGLFGVSCVEGHVKTPHSDTEQDAYNEGIQYKLKLSFCTLCIAY
jgi:hypothetical protein